VIVLLVPVVFCLSFIMLQVCTFTIHHVLVVECSASWVRGAIGFVHFINGCVNIIVIYDTVSCKLDTVGCLKLRVARYSRF
jgi:hypothetical protein